jgi:hypothetical protein
MFVTQPIFLSLCWSKSAKKEVYIL